MIYSCDTEHKLISVRLEVAWQNVDDSYTAGKYSVINVSCCHPTPIQHTHTHIMVSMHTHVIHTLTNTRIHNGEYAHTRNTHINTHT